MSTKRDPRQAETLGEACANGDGTYNGYRLMSWLSEVLAPGRGYTEDEVRKMHREVLEKRAQR